MKKRSKWRNPLLLSKTRSPKIESFIGLEKEFKEVKYLL
jgi:hypothetical protein